MQHERAAVMALTFCIGFTTAFIAYGVPQVSAPVPVAFAPATQPAAIIIAESPESVPAPAPSAAVATAQPGVALDKEGLWFLRNGERLLVSPSIASAPTIPEAHVDVHQAVARADGAYLFFCAETAAAAGVCEPRVFDSTNFGVHRIQSQGQTGTLDPAQLEVSWQSDGRLAINGFVSSSAVQPWVVE